MRMKIAQIPSPAILRKAVYEVVLVVEVANIDYPHVVFSPNLRPQDTVFTVFVSCGGRVKIAKTREQISKDKTNFLTLKALRNPILKVVLQTLAKSLVNTCLHMFSKQHIHWNSGSRAGQLTNFCNLLPGWLNKLLSSQWLCWESLRGDQTSFSFVWLFHQMNFSCVFISI